VLKVKDEDIVVYASCALRAGAVREAGAVSGIGGRPPWPACRPFPDEWAAWVAGADVVRISSIPASARRRPAHHPGADGKLGVEKESPSPFPAGGRPGLRMVNLGYP